jgi:hypothetical protein
MVQHMGVEFCPPQEHGLARRLIQRFVGQLEILDAQRILADLQAFEHPLYSLCHVDSSFNKRKEKSMNNK